MAGILIADTLRSSLTTPPTVQNTNGTEIGQFCRAWVNFNGTNASIRSSFNVSSVTRNATGDYTVNFTTAMPDSFFAAATSSGLSTVGNYQSTSNARNTTFVRMGSYLINGASAVDGDITSCAVFR